jgi:uncharacterized protein YjbJ (UPF0337 family)
MAKSAGFDHDAPGMDAASATRKGSTMSDHDMEKTKGTAKEVAGKVTGSDELAKEGQAQQDKAEAKQEAKDAERRQDQHS